MIDSYIMYEKCQIENDETLNFYYKEFEKNIKNYKKSKLNTCYCLYTIKNYFTKNNDNLYLKISYGDGLKLESSYSFSKFCKVFFGFNSGTTSKYLNVYEKFLNPSNNDEKWIRMFEKFDISKLMELLYVDINQLKQDIPAKLDWFATVDSIRKYVKSFDVEAKSPKNVDNVDNLSTIDDTNTVFDVENFDVDISHDNDFFKDLSKENLISIIKKYEDIYLAIPVEDREKYASDKLLNEFRDYKSKLKFSDIGNYE